MAKKLGIWLIAIVGGGCVVFFACRLWIAPIQDPNAHVREIADGFLARTLPADSRLLGEVKTVREKWYIEASWEVECSCEWEEYVRLVTDRFAGDFKHKRLDDSEIMFVRQLPGDTYRVSLKRMPTKALRVLVTFRGYPS